MGILCSIEKAGEPESGSVDGFHWWTANLNALSHVSECIGSGDARNQHKWLFDSSFFAHKQLTYF